MSPPCTYIGPTVRNSFRSREKKAWKPLQDASHPLVRRPCSCCFVCFVPALPCLPPPLPSFSAARAPSRPPPRPPVRSLASPRFRVASSVLVFCLPAARCPSPAASFAAFFFPPALSPAPCFLLCPRIIHGWERREMYFLFLLSTSTKGALPFFLLVLVSLFPLSSVAAAMVKLPCIFSPVIPEILGSAVLGRVLRAAQAR